MVGVAASGDAPIAAVVVLLVVCLVELAMLALVWFKLKPWRREQRERWRQAPASGRRRAKLVLAGEGAAAVIGAAVGAVVAQAQGSQPVIGAFIGAFVALAAFGVIAWAGLIAVGVRRRNGM